MLRLRLAMKATNSVSQDKGIESEEYLKEVSLHMGAVVTDLKVSHSRHIKCIKDHKVGESHFLLHCP